MVEAELQSVVETDGGETEDQAAEVGLVGRSMVTAGEVLQIEAGTAGRGRSGRSLGRSP